MVHPADGARHAELGLGQQRMDQVRLVVAGRRDGDVAGVEAGLLEAGQLTRVRQQPLGLRHAFGLDRVGVAIDQQNLVAVGDQLPGDRAAHVAGSGDDDTHS